MVVADEAHGLAAAVAACLVAAVHRAFFAAALWVVAVVVPGFVRVAVAVVLVAAHQVFAVRDPVVAVVACLEVHRFRVVHFVVVAFHLAADLRGCVLCLSACGWFSPGSLN